MIIAIDGPSGAGKSTVSKLVATELGFCCLDTGAMFRSVAWLALEQGISLEDGERSIHSVVSTNKEDPVESKPIGRIEYLGSDGKFGERIEHTSPYSFEKDIKEETYYGVPMNLVLYKDKDGGTVPHSFILSLTRLLKGFEIIDSPYMTDQAPEKAKQIIDAFVRE